MVSAIDPLENIADYYSRALAEHGPTARGVDWNGTDSQQLRFAQLCSVISEPGGFSLHDVGCGYGALLEFLRARYSSFSYLGTDLATDMVRAASERCAAGDARFEVGTIPDASADYTVASGVFNVRLGVSDGDWLRHIEDTLDAFDATSRRGFAFNCLTKYSDVDRMRGYLYYADPCALFDRCKRCYSRNVALLHDYDLYEFTILVRKRP
jgi:SAM-dependent methyltransferase